MRTDLFDYDLPNELIATEPPQSRSGGRMCVLGAEGPAASLVALLPQALGAGDLVVLNDSRVRPARLFVARPRLAPGQGGGQVELVFLELLGSGVWEVLGRANRPLRVGDVLIHEASGVSFTVIDKGERGVLRVETAADVDALLEQFGEMPLPPYMARRAAEGDRERYQTVYAKDLGSAAAPTAGLHLTDAMLDEMKARGVGISRLTLHVGLGTFRPVETDDLNDHPMHSEAIAISPELSATIAVTHARKNRVVAIGTTVVRALEAAAEAPGLVRSGTFRTELLIQPGYEFKVVDSLLTNFHQPRSTLLALVSAFAGYERTMQAYSFAMRERFRFLSYGDAMWIPERMRP